MGYYNVHPDLPEVVEFAIVLGADGHAILSDTYPSPQDVANFGADLEHPIRVFWCSGAIHDAELSYTINPTPAE